MDAAARLPSSGQSQACEVASGVSTLAVDGRSVPPNGVTDMKTWIMGAAALGALSLLGCQTDTAMASHSSEVSSPARIAQNPDIARGSIGPLIRGTVVADYKDTLIVRDDQGLERSMRIDEKTVYRDHDGDIVAREYLAPGAQVRTSFDYNNHERIAHEVVIDHEKNLNEPNAWPEEPSAYH